MVQKLENEPCGEEKPNPPSPKSRLAVLKRNKKPAVASTDPFRFQGNGITYKGKLIGERDVDSARGDSMCSDAMRMAKAAVKAAGAHKTRILLQINIDGIKILDEKSNAVLHNFPVSRISFIARDTSDARAFGLVFSSNEVPAQYKFYGIKTAQTADHAVLAIRDMFQVVFEMKKKHIEQVKQQHQDDKDMTAEEGGVAVADLLDLETELSIIEQGMQQVQQIPTHTDIFGSAPFDPFTDSFASNASSFNTTNSTINNSVASGGMNHSGFTPFHTPQTAWAPPPPPQTAQFHDVWGVSPMVQPIHQVYSTPSFNHNTFSETNPFASAAVSSSSSNPFGVAPPAPPAPSVRTPVEWGMNENTAPNLHHANSFPTSNAFADSSSQHKWEENKKVTSLEEAFTKLVDMDSLVGRPAETKKNPFEHILNPPKASLNALGTPVVPYRPVPPVSAPSDPFGDAFFR